VRDFHDYALYKFTLHYITLNFKAAYQKCIRKMFCYARRDSMSGILLELAFLSVNTIVHNSRFVCKTVLCSVSVRVFNGLQLLMCSSRPTGLFYTVVIILIFCAFLLGFSVLCVCMF